MLAREVAFHIITYFIDVLMINLIDMSNKVQVWPNSLFRLVKLNYVLTYFSVFYRFSFSNMKEQNVKNRALDSLVVARC